MFLQSASVICKLDLSQLLQSAAERSRNREFSLPVFYLRCGARPRPEQFYLNRFIGSTKPSQKSTVIRMISSGADRVPESRTAFGNAAAPGRDFRKCLLETCCASAECAKQEKRGEAMAEDIHIRRLGKPDADLLIASDAFDHMVIPAEACAFPAGLNPSSV